MDKFINISVENFDVLRRSPYNCSVLRWEWTRAIVSKGATVLGRITAVS